jgi:hypothetical protein
LTSLTALYVLLAPWQLAKQAADAELKAQQDELARSVVLALRNDLSSGRLVRSCPQRAWRCRFLRRSWLAADSLCSRRRCGGILIIVPLCLCE